MREIERFEISLKAFIVKGARVLMVREADTGLWELPGGRIDKGEAWLAFEAILARELAEELGTGFTVAMTDQLVPLMRQRPQDGQHILQLVRLCTWVAGEPTLSPEHASLAWLTEAETRGLAYPERSTYGAGMATLWALERYPIR
jgi:8-oxo-dGTP pyrophosphatase MutT (NUDIX family)